jgi:chromosome segregation ATPase
VQRPVRLVIALVLTLGVVALARADDDASQRQELETLRGKIEQLDAALTDTDKASTALKEEADDYAAKVAANAATGEAIKQRGQQLTARGAELADEHTNAEKLCMKTTATTEEYQAVLAQCDKARQAYQQHADGYRADQQHLTADYAAYNAAAKELQARYQDIDKKRQDIVAKQASLKDARQQTLAQFDALRDRLNPPQPAAK